MDKDTHLGGSNGTFLLSQMPLVLAATSADSEERCRALAALLNCYWRPIYKYLRTKWLISNEVAKDLTQEFLARALEKSLIEKFDPSQARLRTYLRIAVDGFVSNHRKSFNCQERGGAIDPRLLIGDHRRLRHAAIRNNSSSLACLNSCSAVGLGISSRILHLEGSMLMNRLVGHLVIGILLLNAKLVCHFARGQDQAKSPEINRLVLLERLVGEWTVSGKWNNGEELRARNVYEWRLGNKIMKSETFVKADKGEYQRYEGVMAWHPKKKCLFIISFAYDGNMTENVIEAKGDDTLLIGFIPFHEGEPSKVRQTILFKDNDHFTWKVELHGDQDWQELINATWVRKTK